MSIKQVMTEREIAKAMSKTFDDKSALQVLEFLVIILSGVIIQCPDQEGTLDDFADSVRILLKDLNGMDICKPN